MSEQTSNLSRRAFVGTAATIGAILALDPQTAFAVTAAEKQAEADEVKGQLVSLQADLERASSQYYGALEEKDAAEASMQQEQVKIDEANTQIAALKGRLSERAVSMYRTGPGGFLDFLLGASSFQQLSQNWDLLNRANDEDARLVEETKQQKRALQDAKDEFARQKDIAAAKADEAATIRAQVEVRVAESQKLLNSLSAEARELLEQEQAAAAAAAAEQAAREAAAEAARNARQNAGGGGNGGGGWGGGAPSYTPSYDYGGSPGDYSAVVGYAMSRIGSPYVWGAGGPDAFDCSGLVTWAYAQIGVSLPHYSESLFAAAKRRVPVSEARPGDVLYRCQHVGIAVSHGGAHYVHAPTFGALVRDTDSLSWSNFTHALQF
ncbi:hydrolase Nlp/P60 [Eggerthellaceae bacterium zg-1084]|uniref:Hydrolase Nlp/P60 n=1 Tax=Berryella wangjianweii TaxID=2734634 RepID=A0A6M8J458_9ACTN|nr:C40 family peptidase [Berryella wangjianweii]NPD31464.1 hydrolase Nlp/P60 [Berryella wangjianweii]QKF07911.1 hydrolase Nlp/P60 [Berryella wangjianweii]